jgi:hypothetical protein
MTFATDLVQLYRAELQHLWNTHFWNRPTFEFGSSLADFSRLKQPLFEALVARRLSDDASDDARNYSQLFGEAFRVVPRMATAPEIPLRSLMIESTESHARGQWQELVGPFRGKEVHMTLVDVYDWNQQYWRDFRMFIVDVHRLDKYPDLAGRKALVDVLDVDILWEAPYIEGLRNPIAVPQV